MIIATRIESAMTRCESCVDIASQSLITVNGPKDDFVLCQFRDLHEQHTIYSLPSSSLTNIRSLMHSISSRAYALINRIARKSVRGRTRMTENIETRIIVPFAKPDETLLPILEYRVFQKILDEPSPSALPSPRFQSLKAPAAAKNST